MPTTDDYQKEEDRPATVIERVAIVSREVIGSSERLPIRVIGLFFIAMGAVITAPLPINAIGAWALIFLALDTAAHRRA